MLKALFFMLSLFTFFCYTAVAQGSFGDLRGTVTDSAGAAVSGATVEVVNQQTNEKRTVTTNGNGEFVVTKLNVGSYTINTSSQGFTQSTIKDVKISVAFVTEQSIQLGVAGAQEVVTVTSGDASTQINVTDQQLSTIINNRKILDLPLLSRDP